MTDAERAAILALLHALEHRTRPSPHAGIGESLPCPVCQRKPHAAGCELAMCIAALEPAPKRLTPLAEHNENVFQHFHTPNGIACPKCGKELVDANDGITLTSMPPQYNVGCPACGWRGTRH